MQALGDAIEGEADFEVFLGDRQVPELVLEDDRHFLRVARLETRRHPHAFGAGVESDEEMMLAREPLGGGFGEHRANHAAQRVLGQEVITDIVDRHGFVSQADDAPGWLHDSAATPSR